jgi:hypothetical protein
MRTWPTYLLLLRKPTKEVPVCFIAILARILVHAYMIYRCFHEIEDLAEEHGWFKLRGSSFWSWILAGSGQYLQFSLPEDKEKHVRPNSSAF